MTAGMAANRPMAVARSASAMPGATTARFVVCSFEIPMKLFMMPQTVPNKPTNGAVAPIVASIPIPKRTRRVSDRVMSEKLDATLSLTPASLSKPGESLISSMAAATKDRMTLRSDDSIGDASPKVRAPTTECTALRSLRFAIKSSMNFATKIVQVTKDAKTSPAMMACTIRLAETNIDQGDNSRSPTATDLVDEFADGLDSRAAPAAGGAA